MNDFYKRTTALIGAEAMDKIRRACVCVIGLGGVGSFAVEGLVRAGVGKLIVADNEKVDSTNLNRQVIALRSTVGLQKTTATINRAKDINESISIISHEIFVEECNIAMLLDNERIDYIIDAIDSVNSKLAVIKYAKRKNINIISSMGTGNKLDPNRFEITDIFKTSVCPLARRIRKQLIKMNIDSLDVLYSTENPVKHDNELKEPASISFVPSVAGLIISGYVINKIIKM